MKSVKVSISKEPSWRIRRNQNLVIEKQNDISPTRQKQVTSALGSPPNEEAQFS